MSDCFEKKITITRYVYAKLLNDRLMFNMDDRSENEFFSTICLNTYRYIQREEKSKVDWLKEDSELEGNELLKAIRKPSLSIEKDFSQFYKKLSSSSIEDTAGKRLEKKCIFIREYKGISGELSRIYRISGEKKASKFFESLLFRYLSFPQYIRERIVFERIYEIISSLKINDYITVKRMNGYERQIRFYDIVPGKEEFYNYLIGYGYDRNGLSVFSLKLSSIIDIYNGARTDIPMIDRKIKENIESRLSTPEFAGFDQKEYTVYFDSYGLSLYKRYYKDRPEYISFDRNENKYVFLSTEHTLVHYLSQFGWHALPKDKEIRDKLKDYYTKALYLFNEDDEKILNDKIETCLKEEERYKETSLKRLKDMI